MEREKLVSAIKESISKYNKNGHGHISHTERDTIITGVLNHPYVKAEIK